MNGYRKYKKIFSGLSIVVFVIYLYFGFCFGDWIDLGSLFILTLSLGSLFLGTRSNNFYDKWEQLHGEAKKDLDELNKQATSNKQNKNIIKCPTCQSREIEFMQNNKKGFSVGKAIGGAALTGGVGTLAGFAGKKGKNQWFCTNCHTTFETK